MPVVRAQLEEDPVDGKRLGRHVHHDSRSRSYAVQAAPLGSLVSVRHHRRVAPYDQGQLGSCTGNAGCGVLSTYPFPHHFGERTAVMVYSQATKIDSAPGSYPPDDTGSDGLAVAKVVTRHGWASSYQHAFSLEAALTALQTSAVMLGMTWRAGCDTPSADGLVQWTGSVRGGHEVCVDEIDVTNRRVGITNSWGTGWGLNGRCYLTWDDLQAALHDQGDVTVLVR